MISTAACAFFLVSILPVGSAWGETKPEMMPVQTTELPAQFFYVTLSPQNVPELSFTHLDPADSGPDAAAHWDAFARFSVITRDREGPLAVAFVKARDELRELKLPDFVTFDNYDDGAGTPQGQRVRDYLRMEADRVIGESRLAELLYVPVPQAEYEETLAIFQTVRPLEPDDLFGYCPSAPGGIRVEANHPLFSRFKIQYENDPAFRQAFDRAGTRFRAGQGEFGTIEEKNVYLHQVLREEGVLPGT